MSRLVLLLVSGIVGALLAFAFSFGTSEVLNGANQTPANQTIYNYGSP